MCICRGSVGMDVTGAGTKTTTLQPMVRWTTMERYTYSYLQASGSTWQFKDTVSKPAVADTISINLNNASTGVPIIISSGPRFARPPLGGLYITKVICWVRRPRPPTKKVNKNYINIPYVPISAHAGGSHAYGTFMRRGYDDSTTRPRRMRAMCASRGIESYRPQPRHGARV